METKRVNDWMRDCSIVIKIAFLSAGGGVFYPEAGVEQLNAIRHAIKDVPWLVQEGRLQRPIKARVQRSMDRGYEYDLILEEGLQASHLYAFQLYLSALVQQLYDLKLDQVGTLNAKMHIMPAKIFPHK